MLEKFMDKAPDAAAGAWVHPSAEECAGLVRYYRAGGTK